MHPIAALLAVIYAAIIVTVLYAVFRYNGSGSNL